MFGYGFYERVVTVMFHFETKLELRQNSTIVRIGILYGFSAIGLHVNYAHNPKRRFRKLEEANF